MGVTDASFRECREHTGNTLLAEANSPTFQAYDAKVNERFQDCRAGGTKRLKVFFIT